MQTFTMTQPDDWHVHFRDQSALAYTVPATAAHFGRAVVMPNLKTPVTTLAQAEAYYRRIMANIPVGSNFTPLMTLYLTQNTTVEDIKAAQASGLIHAYKLYPAGATTNSAEGVGDIEKIYPVFAACEKYKLPLLIHGEVVTPDIDIFDREAVFIDRHLIPIRQHFPELKIVLEHITTQTAVEFIESQDQHLAATITPQHLLYHRNDLLVGGIKPHFYCLPILKRQSHQVALIRAATSGNPQFFLGTDSAPHAQRDKESACGCAGCYSAPFALSLYAQAFDGVGKLAALEGFASFYGADFYGLPRNTHQICLEKRTITIPDCLPYIDEQNLIPLGAKQALSWVVV